MASELLLGEKVPVPVVLHTKPVTTAFLVPVTGTVVTSAHLVRFGPALIAGTGVMVTTIWLCVGTQLPTPVVVNVRVTVPAVLSAAEGV